MPTNCCFSNLLLTIEGRTHTNKPLLLYAYDCVGHTYPYDWYLHLCYCFEICMQYPITGGSQSHTHTHNGYIVKHVKLKELTLNSQSTILTYLKMKTINIDFRSSLQQSRASPEIAVLHKAGSKLSFKWNTLNFASESLWMISISKLRRSTSKNGRIMKNLLVAIESATVLLLIA